MVRAVRMKLAMFIPPSTISMSPTENSIESPMRAGMTTSKKEMMAVPTTKIVKVWPIPQKIPVSAAFSTVCAGGLRIVVTPQSHGQDRWRGRIPRKNPTAIMDRKLIMEIRIARLDYFGCS